MSIKLAVHGASGRMGEKVLTLARQFAELELVAALVSEKSKVLGQSCNLPHAGQLVYSSDIRGALQHCDVVVDFSTPRAALNMLEVAEELRKPVVLGTTGFSKSELEQVHRFGRSIALLAAANFSIGLNALRKLTLQATTLLGPEFQIEIMEIHHAGKKDAPSGSALKVAADLQQLRSELEVVTDRSQRNHARSANELGVCSLRGGNVSGEHRVYFLGSDERVELLHTVSDRSVFARGALKMCILLCAKPAGLYDILDLL